MTCKRCGSYAINPHHHGRDETVDLDLCDVCYWRKRAERKPLTDDELKALAIEHFGPQLDGNDFMFARAIEAAHGIKE